VCKDRHALRVELYAPRCIRHSHSSFLPLFFFKPSQNLRAISSGDFIRVTRCQFSENNQRTRNEELPSAYLSLRSRRGISNRARARCPLSGEAGNGARAERKTGAPRAQRRIRIGVSRCYPGRGASSEGNIVLTANVTMSRPNRVAALRSSRVATMRTTRLRASRRARYTLVKITRVSLSLLVYFSFSSLFLPPFLLLFAPPALLLVLLSGHMGTFGIMGWERLERKSSAYNRLDEI